MFRLQIPGVFNFLFIRVNSELISRFFDLLSDNFMYHFCEVDRFLLLYLF